MELTKIKAKYSGWNIICKVGNRDFESWWSAPPEKVDHVGLHYLSDRYPIINTEKRAEKFKELYKKLWL